MYWHSLALYGLLVLIITSYMDFHLRGVASRFSGEVVLFHDNTTRKPMWIAFLFLCMCLLLARTTDGCSWLPALDALMVGIYAASLVALWSFTREAAASRRAMAFDLATLFPGQLVVCMMSVIGFLALWGAGDHSAFRALLPVLVMILLTVFLVALTFGKNQSVWKGMMERGHVDAAKCIYYPVAPAAGGSVSCLPPSVASMGVFVALFLSKITVAADFRLLVVGYASLVGASIFLYLMILRALGIVGMRDWERRNNIILLVGSRDADAQPADGD